MASFFVCNMALDARWGRAVLLIFDFFLVPFTLHDERSFEFGQRQRTLSLENFPSHMSLLCYPELLSSFL